MEAKRNSHWLQHLAPLPYQSLDEKGKIIAVNQIWLDTLGYKQEEVLGRYFTDFLSPDSVSRFKKNFLHIKTSGRAQNNEMQLKHKDGSSIHTLINGAAEYDENGMFQRTHCLFTNITEQKQLEERIRNSEEKSRILADNSVDVIWILDSGLKTTFVSPSVKNLLGYSPEEVLYLSPEKMLSAESLSIMKEAAAKRMATEKEGKKDKKIRLWELEFIRKDGSTVWTELITKPLYDKKGKFTGLLETIRDISDRKQAYELLKSEQFKLKEFFENLPLLAYNVGLDGKIVDCNQVVLKSLGYKSKKELIGKHLISTVYAPSSRDKAKKLLEKLKKTGILKNEEMQIVTKQGEILDILLNVDTIYDKHGDALFSISTHLDITEKKKAENRIGEEKDRARKYLDIAGVIMVALNEKGDVTLINQKGCEMLGSEANKIVGKNWFDNFLPERIREDVKKVYYELLGGDLEAVEYFENPLINKKGEERFISWHNTMLTDERGGIIGTLSSGEDITERKLAEEALKQSEARLGSILQASPIGLGMVRNRVFQFVNDHFLGITGYSRDRLIGKSARLVYPSDKEFERVGKCKYAEIKKKGIGTIETRFKRNDGKITDVYLSSCPIDQTDLSKGVIFAALDISERKKAEKALQASEKKYRDMVELIPDMILTVSLKGIVTSCNEIIIKTTGFSKDEIVGKHIAKLPFVRMKDVTGYLKILASILKGNVPDPFSVQWRHKDGTIRMAEVRVNLMKEDGKITGIQAMGTDITDRKKAEEALRDSREQLRDLAAHLQSVREQERTHLAREIHDELGQALTALKMDITWLNKTIPIDQKPQLQRIKAMIKLIDKTIENVQKISSELRPSLLDDLGLIVALEWQAEEFQKRTGIECKMSLASQDIQLDRESSTAIFRIFQETLTNVARHAQASKVTLSLREKNSWLIMKVRDNGKGITEKNISDTKSFGILGIKERVEFIKGKVAFYGVKDKGTAVEVKIPYKGLRQ